MECNLIISYISQTLTWKHGAGLKQIDCERIHVYVIPAHQRTSKVMLHDSLVFVACAGKDTDIFFTFSRLLSHTLCHGGITSGDIQYSRKSSWFGICGIPEDHRCWSSFVAHFFSIFMATLLIILKSATSVKFCSYIGGRLQYMKWTSNQDPVSTRQGPQSTSYSMAAFALFPQFDENSSRDSSAECQRVGKTMFFSSWAEGAGGVQMGHVTRCCDSFPAHWH